MKKSSNDHRNWSQEDAQVFWGEIAPCDHVVQIYEDDQAFINLLSGFVLGGIRTGESVVVIATAAHLAWINEALKSQAFDPFYLKTRDKYIPLDAPETLSRFMVNGWPDEKKFNDVISPVLKTARKDGTRVRAFGEMVALLWSQGSSSATVELERLWNKITSAQPFSLFCAYPKSGFTDYPAMRHICATHSKVIDSAGCRSNDIVFREVEEGRMRRASSV